MGNAIDNSDASSRTGATEQVPKDRLAPLPSANPNFSAAHLPGTERAHSTGSQIALQQQIPDKKRISVSNNVPLHGLSDQKPHNLSAGSCIVRPELEYISHDATELSDYLSNRLAKRYLYASGEGQVELSTLKEAVVQYTPYLNLPNLSYMKPEHMWPLLRSFNTTFFAGMVRLKSAEQFKWLDIADHRILALCTTNHDSPTIYLHPWRLDLRKLQAQGYDPHFPMRDRLSSILHELCHALFISNCAPSTSSWDCGVGNGGHGPAWRRIAYTIEEVSIPTLGFQLDLGRDVNRIFDAEHPGNTLLRLKAHTPSSRSIFYHQSLDMTLPYGTSSLLIPRNKIGLIEQTYPEATESSQTFTLSTYCQNISRAQQKPGTKHFSHLLLPSHFTECGIRARAKATLHQNVIATSYGKRTAVLSANSRGRDVQPETRQRLQSADERRRGRKRRSENIVAALRSCKSTLNEG